MQKYHTNRIRPWSAPIKASYGRDKKTSAKTVKFTTPYPDHQRPLPRSSEGLPLPLRCSKRRQAVPKRLPRGAQEAPKTPQEAPERPATGP